MRLIFAFCMALPPFFDPTQWGIELVYTMVVVVLCFFIYLRTREMAELTRYKGIGYFRTAFLLFGLTFVLRFVLHLSRIGSFGMPPHPGFFLFPLLMVPVSYLSTLALFYLLYSTMWKRLPYSRFVWVANVAAFLVMVFAFFTRSPEIVTFLQLVLMVVILVMAARAKKKRHSTVLYTLVVAAWLLSLLALGRYRMIFEFKLLAQLVSVVAFIAVYFKVRKWTK